MAGVRSAWQASGVLGGGRPRAYVAACSKTIAPETAPTALDTDTGCLLDVRGGNGVPALVGIISAADVNSGAEDYAMTHRSVR